MIRAVEVDAPSRLHFGMFSFGQTDVPQFGGVGAMIDAPGIHLRMTASAQVTARGPLAARAQDIAREVLTRLKSSRGTSCAGCTIEFIHAAPEHAGLGTGTQLSLAVAAGLVRLNNLPLPEPADLAKLAGRGLRSAVGTYGFFRGGLIIEAGKLPHEPFAPLVSQVPLPAAWRFVLLHSSPDAESAAGLSGTREQDAFKKLPPVPVEVTAALCQEALLNLVPAAETSDFTRFSESLYRFGQLAGTCFAAIQGGAFASRRLEALILALQQLGAVGVGQSSWGPTLFALCKDESSARALIERMERVEAARGVQFTIAAPVNDGAAVQVTELD